VVYAATLMSWQETKSLNQRFEAVLEQLHALFPRWPLGSTYTGWCSALRVWAPKILPALTDRLRDQMEKIAPRFWFQEGWLAFAADGSRVECPRTQSNEDGLGCAGKNRTAPQLMLTTLYHMGTGLPWAFEVGPGTESERCQLEKLVDLLPADSLLVTDAGFAGYDLCAALQNRGRYFLLRVGSNKHLLKELGYACEIQDETVYLWPERNQKHGDPPLVLRLIVLGSGRQRMYLITNVLDPKRLSKVQAGRLYGMRWGVEVFYRSYKRTMEHYKMLSRTPATCLEELRWTMIGLWVMGLMSVGRIVAGGAEPLAWSVAASRDGLRRALRGALSDKRPPIALGTQLARALKDTYVRTHPKTARNWPYKKKEQPPGPPKIRPAEPKEIERAQGLNPKTVAA
jgi:hypothetical protein